MSVYFAIPTRGDLNWQIAGFIRELAEELQRATGQLPKVEPHFHVGHLSVAAVRNRICEDFLASGCETLLMLDDDVTPAGNTVSILDGLAIYDVVAAAVPVWREQDAAPSFAAFGANQQPIVPDPSVLGPTAVAFVGTGCIAIRRRVIELLSEVNEGSVFRVEVRNGREVSEDVIFCEQARDCAFAVACDFRVRCDHTMKVSLRRVAKLA